MKPYTYTPLAPQHIRLLTLYPGRLSDLIEVSLDHVLFTSDEYPKYEALSYCWGSEDDPQTITIHPDNSSLVPAALGPQDSSDTVRPRANSRREVSGADSESVAQCSTAASFSVSSNLHSALLHLRREFKSRVLWIDAICINQPDNEEKSIQIRKMGSIYRKAGRVVVWLGPASDHSQRAVDVLDHLGHQAAWEPETSRVDQAQDCDPDCEEWYRYYHTLEYTVDTWAGIADLLSRPWFTRVWIWQEIGLANQTTSVIRCGLAEISWVAFKNSIMCLVLKHDNGSQPELSNTVLGSNLGKVQRLVSIQGVPRTILDLLDHMRNHTFCYNPRDRLYALLDFAWDAREVNIQPDYNSTVAQVYYDYCIKVVDRYKSSLCKVLFLMSCEIESWQEGPTWVPNWSEPSRRGTSAVYTLSAHSGSALGKCELIDGLTLRVNAVRCGVVQSHSSTAPANLSMATILPLLKSWLSGISDDIILKQILLVVMDDSFNSRLGGGYPTFEEAREFMNLCMMASPVTPSEDNSRSRLHLVFSSLRTIVSGRCLFKTTTGHWGLGPPCIQAGDLVYSIIGSSCLMLLRKNEQQRFIVVGMCSLEGHTDMEALLGQLPSGYHVEDSQDRWACGMWFVNPHAGIKTRVDPRLDSDYPGWLSRERDEDDHMIWQNLESGEKGLQDPRHSDISFLRRRGVKIESIDIV